MSELQFPLKNDTSRKIIHIDMDAFFASVEERDDPELAKHPLVIARHPSDTGGRGVVTTANYLARQYGIHSAMSAQKAYELCPQAIFKPGNHQKYREVSQQVREIFHRYTDIIEPVSIDEAYLDVTVNKINCPSAIKIARLIQRDIWHETHLTCSAGVSYNKFLAKLSSDYHKPRGLTVVMPDEAVAFLQQLPIDKFHGIGKKTVPRMHELGIFTGADLYTWSEMALIREFGKMGYSLYRKVRGIHDSPVSVTRERKSVGKEHTYGNPLTSEEQVLSQLRAIAEEVERSLKRTQKHGKTVVLKVRYSDYSTITKRVTLPIYVHKKEQLFSEASLIWEEILGLEKGIRLLGITVTNLDPLTYENIVLPLWQTSDDQ
ncbi:DNA-damage-inducible protein P [Enterococcus sp. AZ089]|jgi:DNA polymerase-4|uniref:DNA polymerase IV n=1 Tax=unclassified Enterococcus TaxID=2608891 RepID=UPI000352C305|nr:MULTISPECIES: DNA polymerase IV [unclassified Enterococcus]AMG50331.1 DNA polymerase IV [Enterococcus gallinarum]EPH90144.1 putative DNA polymerase IV [Enterococcus faecalis 06-MB-DW-09]MBE9894552.1 DNA polymerase IV [Enterococcus casseliflavus]AUJ85176.1 DNA polymerase IV [Enterococcus sp. CR-Ec1]MBF0013933.1 DNA polymerase IV [Enterococcus casseliflavus]